ncbi:MAG: multicopper oxidase family protein, partial [Alphaproteobacteria bacterium]|nr:multicopper oxidase family protein [Alphaproteobacteria bacterium]
PQAETAPLSGADRITRSYQLDFTPGETIINGGKFPAILANNQFVSPTLRANQGDLLEVAVHNGLNSELLIHWHGVHVPPNMDGAAGFNGVVPIKSGDSFTYRIPISQTGTYWYHAHGETQEQLGIYGGLVFYPAGESFSETDPKDHMIILSDHAKETPEEIYQAFKAAHKKGEHESSDFYQLLINGKGTQDNLTFTATPGEKIHLRLVNAAAMTMFQVALDQNIPMTVVAADGQPIKPVTVSSVILTNGETRDVVITPYMAGKFKLSATEYSFDVMADMGDMDDMGAKKSVSATFATASGSKSVKAVKYDAKKFKALKDDNMIDAIPDRAAAPIPPARTIPVRLTGNMTEYEWTINDQILDQGAPIKMALGERIKIDFINSSGMAHPMHLHGILFQPIGKNGALLSKRNTILVKDGETRSVILTANQAGEWMLHCHLLYHQVAGMMTRVVVQ